MAAALAVGEALSGVSQLEWGFRWPNDIVIGRRKVCGVLGESKISGEDLLYLLIGIGVNVNFRIRQLPTELRPSATTLLQESQKQFDLASLLVQILSRLETNTQLVQSGRPGEILEVLRTRDVLRGRAVRLFMKREALIGVGQGIQSNGSLLVNLGRSDLRQYSVDEVERVELAEFG
jgi:BirA family biotin operon repressor/biotin-[acetyl-CoA-carboxylase] ligase